MSEKTLIKLILIMLALILLILASETVGAEDQTCPVEQRTIIHKGFARDDPRQDMVWYAYKLGGIEFVALIDCEDGNRDITKKGDGGMALGLCQLNKRRHKWTQDYISKRQSQVEVCHWKRTHHTKFNGPNRKINGQLCKDYVLDRFAILTGNDYDGYYWLNL